MSRIRPRSPTRALNALYSALLNAISTLDLSFSPSVTISRLRTYQFTLTEIIYYLLHAIHATFWLIIMQQPSFPLKLVLPVLYGLVLLIPFTSQFFLPAIPIFAWLLAYYTSRFIPAAYRPSISVSLLPTLESVLYGANISDILTRFTHPILDIIAWLPYGVIHFIAPFFVAAFLWLFSPKPALKFWASVFGYMNLAGVWCQIVFPCSAPWYELIYGLTPANYSMPGSPGGLARIDALFHSNGYTMTFSNAPVVFGAFPSLHSGCATIEALVVSHFFPAATPYVWAYTGVLYWATMYLTHHYLIDVVGGACLATAFFYFFLPAELDHNTKNGFGGSTTVRSKYDQYDLEAPPRIRRRTASAFSATSSLDSQDEEEQEISYRSPLGVNGNPINSGVPFLPQGDRERPPKRGHKHTASIASLIRAEERVEDGWSPIGTGFGMAPSPLRPRENGETTTTTNTIENGIPRTRNSSPISSSR